MRLNNTLIDKHDAEENIFEKNVHVSKILLLNSFFSKRFDLLTFAKFDYSSHYLPMLELKFYQNLVNCHNN